MELCSKKILNRHSLRQKKLSKTSDFLKRELSQVLPKIMSRLSWNEKKREKVLIIFSSRVRKFVTNREILILMKKNFEASWDERKENWGIFIQPRKKISRQPKSFFVKKIFFKLVLFHLCFIFLIVFLPSQPFCPPTWFLAQHSSIESSTRMAAPA